MVGIYSDLSMVATIPQPINILSWLAPWLNTILSVILGQIFLHTVVAQFSIRFSSSIMSILPIIDDIGAG